MQVKYKRGSSPQAIHIFKKIDSFSITREQAFEGLLNCGRIESLYKKQYIESLIWRFPDDIFVKRCWDFGGDYVREMILSKLDKKLVKTWMIEKALNAQYLTGLANILCKRLELIDGNEKWEKTFLKKLFGIWKKSYRGNIDFLIQNSIMPSNEGIIILEKVKEYAAIKDILE